MMATDGKSITLKQTVTWIIVASLACLTLLWGAGRVGFRTMVAIAIAIVYANQMLDL